MSKDCNFSELIDYKNKYELGLNIIYNQYVEKQLMDDELFVQATQFCHDHNTGIGAFEIYSIDPKKILESYDVEYDKTIELRYLI